MNFLTDHAEYYDASLELEKRVVARKEAWTNSRNQSVVSEIKGAFFSGEEEKCRELMGQEVVKLEE